MADISVVIISHNVENKIERCIRSARLISRDIIVVDAFSDDRTPEICRSMGVEFIQKKWMGFSAQKNYGNQMARHDWVFSLDSDEEISADLAKNVLSLERDLDFAKNKVYQVSRLTNYCGQWIRHGPWFPDKHLRLFNKCDVKWNESDLVHESLVYSKKLNVVPLSGYLYHYTANTISEHMEKVDRYASLVAKELFEKGQKPSLMEACLSPAIKFFNDYFIKGALLDGFHGFQICVVSAFSKFLRQIKLRELYRQYAPK